MSRHGRRETQRASSSSYSSSRHSSRPQSYLQNDLAKANQDLLSFSRRDGFLRRYRELNDQDRPLINVWEGVEGFMEHVVEKFPMPSQALDYQKPEHSSRMSKRPLETLKPGSASIKKMRSDKPNLGIQIKLEPVSPSCSDLANSKSEASSKLKEMQCMASERNYNKAEKSVCNKDLHSSKSLETLSHGFDTDDVDEKDSFMVLDSCGEVDADIDDIAQIFEDEEDDHSQPDDSPEVDHGADDLMLALASDDAREVVLQESSNPDPFMQYAHSTNAEEYSPQNSAILHIESSIAATVSSEKDTCMGNNISGSDGQESSPDFLSSAAVPASSDVKSNIISSAEESSPKPPKKAVTNIAQAGLLAHNPSQKTEASIAQSDQHSENSTNQAAVNIVEEGQHPQNPSELQRMFYWPCPVVDAHTLSKDLHSQFTMFDRATQALNTRFHTINSVFLKKLRMNEDISDSDMLKFTELSCLIVSLFSEMEVLRITQCPNTTKTPFTFPLNCVLSKKEKKIFVIWHVNLRRKIEKLKTLYAMLFKDHSNKIFEFNKRVGDEGGIKAPGLHFFNRDGLFSKFLKGSLKVYKVSSLIIKPTNFKYNNDILSLTDRKTLWQPGTLYFDLTLKISSEQKGIVKRKGGVKDSYDIPPAQTQVKGATIFQRLGPPVSSGTSLQNELSITNVKDRICKETTEMICKEVLASGRGDPKYYNESNPRGALDTSCQASTYKADQASNYLEMLTANVKTPDSHETNPGYHTDTFHSLNAIIEGWKRDQKYIRKRIFFLTDKLKKGEKSEETQLKVCTEMAKHSNAIQNMSVQFEKERVAHTEASCGNVKFKFSPEVVADIGQVSANQLCEKMKQVDLNLRVLINSFRSLFFTNLKVMEAYNKSETARQCGRITVPKKLDKLRNEKLSGQSKKSYEPRNESGMSPTRDKEGHHQEPSREYGVPGGSLSEPHLYAQPRNFHFRDSFGSSEIAMNHQNFNELSVPFTSTAINCQSGNAEKHQKSGQLHVGQLSASTSGDQSGANFYPTLPPPPLPPLALSSSSGQINSQQNQRSIYQSSELYDETSHYACYDYSYPGHSETVGCSTFGGGCIQQDDSHKGQPYHNQNDQNFWQRTPGESDYVDYHTGEGYACSSGLQSGYWSEYEACTSSNPEQSTRSSSHQHTDGHSTSLSTNQLTGSHFGMAENTNAGFKMQDNAFPSPRSESMKRSLFSTLRDSQLNSSTSFPTNATYFGGQYCKSLNVTCPQAHHAEAGVDHNRNVQYHDPVGSRAPPPSHLSAKAAAPSFTASSPGRFHKHTDPASFLPGNSKSVHNASSKAGLCSADPADDRDLGCQCGCGGNVVEGIPTMPKPDQKASPEAMHWLRLSLLFGDIVEIRKLLQSAIKWFDKLQMQLNKRAARIYIDVSATLPHLAAIMNQLRYDHDQFRFSKEMPYADAEIENLGVSRFEGNSIEAVEDALHEAYTEHQRLYRERKTLIVRFHNHVDKFRAVRNHVYKIKEPETPNVRTNSPKKRCNTLKDLGVFSKNNDTSKEKIRYYQTLLSVQKKMANVKKLIEAQKRVMKNKGVEYVATHQSTFDVVRKSGTVLMSLKKEMIKIEVFREMYGRYVPRYVQSLLKVNDRGRGKKTMSNHIRNYEFLLKMINRTAKELKDFAESLGSNNPIQALVKDLEIFTELE